MRPLRLRSFQPLASSQLLALWDAGQTRHPIDRALLALALAMPEEAPETLADRPVGWRESHLFALRNATFGSALEGYAPCPVCSSLMEFSLDGNALLDDLAPPPDDARIEVDGRQWRLPSSRDQALIADAPDAETAVSRLLERCRVDVDAMPLLGSENELLPIPIGEIEQRMEALDPGANIRLGLRCDTCGHAWGAVLDIGVCFWDELSNHARQLLQTVHRLASAYGWRESEILALSPARRAAYLELIG
jgi:hypothetical protein